MEETKSGFESGMVKLVVCCPLAEQFGIGKCSNNPVKWQWTKCSHSDFIDDKGFCNCIKCNNKSFIQEVGFKCSGNSHGNDYESFKVRDMVFALQMATKAILGIDTDDDAAMDFLSNMT